MVVTADYADQVYEALPRADQEVVRDLFARLVAGDGTRIPAPRAELAQLPGAPAVIANLIEARLLVVREDEDGVDMVEIVHECLAERWERLARWRHEDVGQRALVADVRAAARRWQESGRRPDMLWRGEALVELRKLLARTGVEVSQLDLVELNEAFASQSLAVIRELGLDPEHVNVNGGAIALGHPLGMSGARLVVSLLHELRRRGGHYGLATLCVGVGQGQAALFER